MSRNFKQLQDRMDPASRDDNRRRVREELQRMTLDELRSAKRMTQADMAEILDVPQSSISRIEQRTDMYLSTLRNYVQAMGGVLQIQAIFPEGPPVVIKRFGEYEDRSYFVWARAESDGTYHLDANPLDQGVPLSIKPLKAQAFAKVLRALGVPEPNIRAIRDLRSGAKAAISTRFSLPDLMEAGFEATADD
jgi:DNA-binding XRE family transcriptional regulator